MDSFKDKDEDIEEFIIYAKICMKNSELVFNYTSYIKPNDESKVLFARIIEIMQYLEKDINSLIILANKLEKYEKINKLNIENYISSSTAINSLRKENIIDGLLCNNLLNLIKTRNYLAHNHYTSKIKDKVEHAFPEILYMMFEARDCISNITSKLKGKDGNIPNAFENKNLRRKNGF
ncbi:MAG: hypothetical protein PHE29_10655 [Tissierellia bacterium]|nr:hypothetical protein [Tissierellia bacterium]